MRKWKAIIWMEDTPPEGESIQGKDEHLTEREINIAMEKAKAAIEIEYEGLKVADFHVCIDKEKEQ